MPTLRTAAAFAALSVLPLSAAPAHAANATCAADVSIATLASGEFAARVTATLNGSCTAAGVHDEIDCYVYLIGATTVLATNHVVGTTDGGCTVSVEISSGLQKTPYVAIGEVDYRPPSPPISGFDVAVAVP